MDIRKISTAARMMRDALDVVGSGPLDFYLDELAASYNLLMERFAPFKVGDRVALSLTPIINEEVTPGWMSCKHFLVKGAVGTVREASCGQGGFRFGVIFDDDTWIDQRGKARPTIDKGMFLFGEEWLKRHTGDSSDAS